MVTEFDSIDVRPFQLMCCVCRLGREAHEAYPHEARLDEIAQAVRDQPSLPVTIRCNVDTNYRYQNPGREFDTPEGEMFNDRRDLHVVRELGLVPGATRPAREMFGRVFDRIPTCRGICGFDEVTSEDWRGCPLADTGNYERGHARGLGAIVRWRCEAEKAAVKTTSAAVFDDTEPLLIRPHHLMCMTCFHGGKDDVAPIAEDNLFEAIDAIRCRPDVPVTLVAGPCMICPPCSQYVPADGQCANAGGMALRDEKKDLDVLQLLGLAYGDTLPGAELLRRLYAVVRSTRQICGHDDGEVTAPEWKICGGAEGNPNYAAGRARGLDVPGVEPDE